MIRRYVLMIFLYLCSAHISAQEQSSDSKTLKNELDDKKHDFTVMPFFSYNRNIEFMFGARDRNLTKTTQSCFF